MISVVDERGEIFPAGAGFSTGPRTDVVSNCTKGQGVSMTVKAMRPHCVAVDEITTEEDCRALLDAGWCGVELLATAHASDTEDLLRRRIYQPLVQSGLFQRALVLQRDKTYCVERIGICTSKLSTTVSTSPKGN